ncbi:hypothetical protein BKA70DRAFT_1428074 [Coprinopsis sp. MPI-PUGE-AT-0042]|nr:hypothetical protein BKA70DRAFT_1428074 [Coprinopsis sp. MPI-PUGE-AT-0042]
MFRRDSLTLPRYKSIRVQPSPSELSEHLRPLLNGYQPEVPLPWWFARDVLSSQIPSPMATPCPGVTHTDSSQFAQACPCAEPMRQQGTFDNATQDGMVHALVSSVADDAPMALRSSTSTVPERRVCDSLQPACVEAEMDLGVVDRDAGHLGHIIVEFTLSSLLSSDTLRLSTLTASGDEDEGANNLNLSCSPSSSYREGGNSGARVADAGKDSTPVPPSPDIPTIPSEDSTIFARFGEMSMVYDGLPYISDTLPCIAESYSLTPVAI